MRTHARVVVIGGGAMGVSLLYHLAKRGWSDVMLVEKTELTAGSTWHAAGLCTHFAHNATIMEMRAHSIRLYREGLTAETGLPTGFHASGALRVQRRVGVVGGSKSGGERIRSGDCRYGSQEGNQSDGCQRNPGKRHYQTSTLRGDAPLPDVHQRTRRR